MSQEDILTPRHPFVNSSQIQVELLETMGSDRAIAESAWTSSYDRSKVEIRTDQDVQRVVTMLASSGHGVPFESFVARFWMRIPIFVDRQVVKYRIQSQSGMSARYRTMPEDWYRLPIDVLHILDEVDLSFSRRIYSEYEAVLRLSHSLYREVLDKMKYANIPNQEYKRVREVIRGVLPVSQMTETSNILNLRSLCNLWSQRLSHDAQPEIRQVAQMTLDLVKASSKIPVAIAELEKNKWRV